MKCFLWVCSLFLCGCASTQLTYNVLDVASSTSQLSTEQVLHNLAQFLDNPAAVPAQVVFGQGSVSTTNTVNATFADPISKTVALTDTVAQAAATTITHQSVDTSSGKSLSLTGGNTAVQSWGIDTIGDPDQLRRLYDLYRFAVDGNSCPYAETALLLDYPLTYSPTNGGGDSSAPAVTIDAHSMIGANCVLCAENSASAPQKDQGYARVCEGNDGSDSINVVHREKAAYEFQDNNCRAAAASYRPGVRVTMNCVELKGISNQIAHGTPGGASLLKTKGGPVCLTINRKTPSSEGFEGSSWKTSRELAALEGLAGSPQAKFHPSPAPDDIYLGLYGHYALYVDQRQP